MGSDVRDAENREIFKNPERPARGVDHGRFSSGPAGIGNGFPAEPGVDSEPVLPIR